jgi:hypothetical protein
LWRGGEGGLSDQRRKGVGGVLGGAGKSDVWLVAAMTVEEKGKRWPRGEKKTREKSWFFLKFGLRFLPLQCLESTLVYRG